jgi:hypothetical protein
MSRRIALTLRHRGSGYVPSGYGAFSRQFLRYLLRKLDAWVEGGGNINTVQAQIVDNCGKLVWSQAGTVEKVLLFTIRRSELDFRVDVCIKMTVHRVHKQPEFENPEVIREVLGIRKRMTKSPEAIAAERVRLVGIRSAAGGGLNGEISPLQGLEVQSPMENLPTVFEAASTALRGAPRSPRPSTSKMAYSPRTFTSCPFLIPPVPGPQGPPPPPETQRGKNKRPTIS